MSINMFGSIHYLPTECYIPAPIEYGPLCSLDVAQPSHSPCNQVISRLPGHVTSPMISLCVVSVIGVYIKPAQAVSNQQPSPTRSRYNYQRR